MSKLTDQLKSSQHPSQTSNDFPKYRKEELDVLVQFGDYLSKYADWWDWIKVETDPTPSTKGQPVAFQLDSLIDPEAVKRWTQLRSQYTAYVQMVSMNLLPQFRHNRKVLTDDLACSLLFLPDWRI